MQEGDFGKRALMKRFRTKCRQWGWWLGALLGLEEPRGNVAAVHSPGGRREM